MTIRGDRDVDIIAAEIRDALLKMAPRVPSPLQYDVICNKIIAAHGYVIESSGRDPDGEPFIVIERP